MPISRSENNVIDTGHHHLFSRRLRMAVTDGAGYNKKTETHIMAQRREEEKVEWLHLHELCQVHILAGIHTRTFSFMDADISSMIACSLSLNQGGEVILFRAALRRTLRSMLVLRREPLPEEAKRYRAFVVSTFYGNSKLVLPAALSLLRLAGGDWRRQDRFEYMVNEDESFDDALEVLHRELVPLLVPHAPRTFPRSRWSGLEEAIVDLAVLQSVHGLLGKAYLDYSST